MADSRDSFSLRELIDSLGNELYVAHQNSFLLQLENWNQVLGDQRAEEVQLDSPVLQGLADKRLLALDEVCLRLKISPAPSRVGFWKRLKTSWKLLFYREVPELDPRVYYLGEGGAPMELEVKLVRDRQGRFSLSDPELGDILKDYRVTTAYSR